MPKAWRVELLGGLRLRREERVITHFRTRKTGALLAYLAFFQHKPHPREKLIDLLWPDSELDAGRQSLSRALSSLRQQLETEGGEGGTILIADRLSVGLETTHVSTDVSDFESALQLSQHTQDDAERAQHLTTAIDLYQGELLPGYYDDWVLEQQERLAGAYVETLSQAIPLLERLGEQRRALDYARRAVTADPLREEAHADLMRLYAQTGQVSAAQRQFKKLQEILEEELGTTPTAATRTLAEEIRVRSLPVTSSSPTVSRATVNETGPAPEPIEGSAAMPAPSSTPEGVQADALNSALLEDPVSPGLMALQAAEEQGLIAGLVGEGENRVVTALVAIPHPGGGGPADPGEIADDLERLYQAVRAGLGQRGGRLYRLMAGRLLAVFGATHTRENDPEHALLAALELQQTAESLDTVVSVGVSTGQAYVGVLATDASGGITVLGPTVDSASRLAELASPGQILVGPLTYQANRYAFEFIPRTLPALNGEGASQAFDLHRTLLRPEKARGVDGLRSEMVGREEETARVRAALEELQRGRGQIICVTGDAGVGKSRLAWEAKRLPLAATGPVPLWLEARSLDHGTTAVYRLFMDLFRHHFSRRAEETEVVRGERILAFLRELLERGDLTPERYEEMGPLLGSLLSARFGNEWDERAAAASPEQHKQQILLALRDFFVVLTRRRPVVLVLDDVHWADELSLDLVSLLMGTLSYAQLLLFCLYRPDRDHRSALLERLAERECPGRFVSIKLKELPQPDSLHVLQSLLGSDDLPAGTRNAILERSHGNPFFLEEIVQALIGSGDLARDGTTWRVREGAATTLVPESVQQVILSRLDRLPPELRRVLQAASVLGPRFSIGLLEAILPGKPALGTALWELESQGLVLRERVVPEEEFAFHHILTQETIYLSLLSRHRRALHQRVAEALEAREGEGLPHNLELLAYHYERSGLVEKARQYQATAEKRRGVHAGGEAIDFLERLLVRPLVRIGGPGARSPWDLV
ncbi:MAG TPA: AAA family ATPase [Armatimonadota bacterium]|jgi:DNA-binding SARP family transcriptional activator